MTTHTITTNDVVNEELAKMQVLRKQLIHVRRKHDDFMHKRRTHLASALWRLRRYYRRSVEKLEQEMKKQLFESVQETISQPLSELSLAYLETVSHAIRESLCSFLSEKRAELTEGLVEKVLSFAETLPPDREWNLFLNPLDLSSLSPQKKANFHSRNNVPEGCACLSTKRGEIHFDWLTPLSQILQETASELHFKNEESKR
jgi:hypothetical protein